MTSPTFSVPRSSHPLHGIWVGMLNRSHNPNRDCYPRYGGRGITVCQRWRGRGGFERFIADMGPRPTSKHSIERMNNNKGYSPSNCKWATRKEQERNKRTNHNLTFNGKTQCLAAWAEELQISVNVLRARLNLGWTVDRMLSTKVRNCHLTHNGKTQSMAAWERELGLRSRIVAERIGYGWSVARALGTKNSL